MKIKTVKASVHRFPVTIPLIDEPIENRKVVLCEVETDVGIIGRGLTGTFLSSDVVGALV